MTLVFGSGEAQAIREKDRLLEAEAALEERAEASGRVWIVKTQAINKYEYRVKAASEEDVEEMWDRGMFEGRTFCDEFDEEIISIKEAK